MKKDKKLFDTLQKYNISQYDKKKINNIFPIFNLILIINIIVIAVSIGLIIAHYVF